MNTRYETRVGFFTLFALILLLYGWGWLKSFSPFDPPLVFWVRFHDIAGLSNNATVNVQGVRVGTVDTISFRPPEGQADSPDTDPELAKLPRVYLRIKLSGQKIPIPQNADITIQTLGMVGAKYIEITLPENTLTTKVKEIDTQAIAVGHDPVRVEMVVNNIAKKLNRAADAISTEQAGNAVRDLAQAASKINKTMDKMPEVADSIKKASDSFTHTSAKFGQAADRTQAIADNANRFFRQGAGTMDSIHTLADNVGNTNTKIGKILDNPNLTRDLKETVELAHKTVDQVTETVKLINSTVKDKEVRGDIMTMLARIQTSTQSIHESLQTVDKLAENNQLRDDVKEVVRGAKDAMTKASEMMSDPQLKVDVSHTLGKVKTAAADVDVAAKQLSQILGKRAPLLHLLMGRPGEISEKQKEKVKDGTTVNATPPVGGSM